jgi:hypothetical protein
MIRILYVVLVTVGRCSGWKVVNGRRRQLLIFASLFFASLVKGATSFGDSTSSLQ